MTIGESIEDQWTLYTFLAEREKVFDAYRAELAKIVADLLALVPDELNDFKEAVFPSIELAIDFFENLYSNSKRWIWNTGKLKNLWEYGFEDDEEAVRKLVLLKEAWNDWIDVNVISPLESGDSYVKIEYKLKKETSSL